MEQEPTIRLSVSDMFGALETKIDAYHTAVMNEVKEQDKRIQRLEFQQKTLRIWGLVALFAGGTGGTLLANFLIA